MRYIFDLDGTVIDSSHRLGDSLDDWRRMNTPANVAKDSPLPLLDQMRDAIADDLDVIICTSRVMAGRDFRWLDDHGIRGVTILCRDVNDDRLCGFFKLHLLKDYADSLGYTWARFCQTSIMFDDSIDVQNTLRSVGLRVIDPVNYNLNIRTA
jgi:phosphoglycolate phosphatase-like HAD superfamily hydrolase